MISATQLWLPKLKKVRVVKKKRKLPEPRIGKGRPLRKFELLHHPLDLRFRGRLNTWIALLERAGRTSIEKVLKPDESQLIKLYLHPQDKGKKWLTQADVLEILEDRPKGRLRPLIVKALLKIWSSNKKYLGNKNITHIR